MTDVTTSPDRKAFRHDLTTHIADIADMVRWVVHTTDFPVPVRDFSPTTWTVYVLNDDEFARLSAVLGRGMPVEVEQTPDYRVCRRRFGTVSVELWQSLRKGSD